jgi:thiol-disulfide isomerase/thioredoxin
MSVVGLVVALAVLVAASAYELARRSRRGHVRATTKQTAALSGDDLGAPLGAAATLVQFSSAFCRPCVAARHVLAAVADELPGVAHVEVDAESRLDLVRRLGVASTPTTLLLDRSGVERGRAGGVPRKAEVAASLAAIGVPVPPASAPHRVP